MKTKFLLAFSFVFALALTGCSNSLDEDNPVSGKGDNVLIVRLPDNVKSTRAVEDQVNGKETTVDDVTVFLLIDQLVERAVELQGEDISKGYKRFEQVPAQVNRVIVVANRVGQDIKNFTSYSQINNYAYTVASQHTKSLLEGRTLMGDATAVEVTGTPESEFDEHNYKEATVSLKAITARIEVGTVIPGEGVESVELVSIYINNFYAKHPQTEETFYGEDHALWKPTAGVGSNVGSKDPIGAITTPDFVPTVYKTLGSSDVKLTADSKVYAFHVFAGNIPHVIMLVKVELKENYYELDDDDQPLKHKYGYLTFSKFKIDATNYVEKMEGHNVYKMGVGTKGIPVNAKDITDKPEKGPYDLGVNIEIEDWNIVNVTPEV